MYVEQILLIINNLDLADKFSIVSTAPEERKIKVVPYPHFHSFNCQCLAESFQGSRAGNPLF